MDTPPTPRLLPWTTPDDKPCYLLTDREGGYVARYAEDVEELQLGMAVGLLEHARELIGDPAVSARQLRFLSVQLSAALRDAVRVAECRGERPAGPGKGA
ncbi:hypothetical protein [Streptomyces sp. NPDC048612]|uniref:hypothetical protein n=1 Tax=Streptomyces sp. NPDC048612 TaxID=3365579 RepID=UPI0037244C3F